MKVVFSSRAKAQLRAIALHIARENRDRAVSFVEELRQAAQDLSRNPLAFQAVELFSLVGIRRRVHGRYSIFYRIVEDRVEIVCILHGAQDYERFLSGLF